MPGQPETKLVSGLRPSKAGFPPSFAQGGRGGFEDVSKLPTAKVTAFTHVGGLRVPLPDISQLPTHKMPASTANQLRAAESPIQPIPAIEKNHSGLASAIASLRSAISFEALEQQAEKIGVSVSEFFSKQKREVYRVIGIGLLTEISRRSEKKAQRAFNMATKFENSSVGRPEEKAYIERLNTTGRAWLRKSEYEKRAAKELRYRGTTVGSFMQEIANAEPVEQAA